MKKILVFGTVVLLCLSGIAADLGESWVLVDEGKMDCQKISIGYNKARVVLKNGKRTTIRIDAIKSYSVYGKVFTKLPLYKNNEPTGQTVFMELITTRGNLSLYKYENANQESITLDDKISSYFVYNGEKMLLELDETTMPNISRVFGVTYSLGRTGLF